MENEKKCQPCQSCKVKILLPNESFKIDDTFDFVCEHCYKDNKKHYYKVLDNFKTGILKSWIVDDFHSVIYKKDQWVTGKEHLKKIGFHLFVFDELENAIKYKNEYSGVIYECEILNINKLPINSKVSICFLPPYFHNYEFLPSFCNNTVGEYINKLRSETIGFYVETLIKNGIIHEGTIMAEYVKVLRRVA